MNIEACNRLVDAIYKQAAQDYAVSIIRKDYSEKRSIENFFRSGAYCVSRQTGEYILQKTKSETKLALKILKDFYESDSEEIQIDGKKVSINIIRTLLYYRYKGFFNVDQKDGFLILTKKPL